MAAKRASGVGRSRVADPTFDSTSRANARASPRRHTSSPVSVKSIGTALLPTQSQKDSVFDSPATPFCFLPPLPPFHYPTQNPHPIPQPATPPSPPPLN